MVGGRLEGNFDAKRGRDFFFSLMGAGLVWRGGGNCGIMVFDAMERWAVRSRLKSERF